MSGTDWATVSGGNIVTYTAYQTDTAPTSWAAAQQRQTERQPFCKRHNPLDQFFRFYGSVDGHDHVSEYLDPFFRRPTRNRHGATNITGGTLKGASGADLIVIQNSSAAMTIGSAIANNTSATGLTKSGAGQLNLTGTNTYTGMTIINSGTLLINGNQSAATGAVIVNGSGTTLGGTGTIGGAVTVNAGGRITGATAGTVGTLTLQSTATFTGSSSNLATYLVDLTSLVSDTLAIAGALDLSDGFDQIQFQGTTGASSYTLATYSSLTGTFDTVTGLPSGYQLIYGPNSLTLQAVPEPSTWIGAALTFLMVGYTQLRKSSRAGGRRFGVKLAGRS